MAGQERITGGITAETGKKYKLTYSKSKTLSAKVRTKAGIDRLLRHCPYKFTFYVDI